MSRIEVFFSGQVQGVGFRYTTCQIARGFSVLGFVENLPDGRVHLIAEGAADELERFVKSIEERMDGYIRNVEQTRDSSTGEFSKFGVRR